MKRRDFVKTAFVSAAAAAFNSGSSAAEPASAATSGAHEFYELRLYHLRQGAMQKRFDEYLKNALVPALNRAGISAVGVFNVMFGPDSPTVYLLLPHKDLASFAALNDRLGRDEEYLKSDGVSAPPSDPLYVRIESSLMVSFDGLPQLVVPPRKSRIFELRTYESHSKKANKKKIEMFNRGEIAIFKRTGLAPVFFGETLIGSKLPNLTYMLTFADMAEREKNWATFIADPEWKKMNSIPEYATAVSNISNIFLRPTAYSQI
ncbi:MAG: NIPSNAP family protein [Limisphaerales bacterium]